MRLQEIRRLMGYSIEDLAKQTGLHPGSIRNIETGVRKTGSPDTQEKLARALGLRRWDLFPGSRRDEKG